ncbi:hypothetical protein PMAC_001171 [Pneumocystis sp. 'macacae']|nr:hypothetical protein PMAC_001171 [Pneumocystis sp. 'macacae']
MKQHLTTFPPTELKKDLLLSQLWEELKIYQLPSNRSIIQGVSPQSHKTFYVYPCSLEERVSIKKICKLYDEVWDILGKDKQTLLLGIVSSDSTIVYYKMSNGLVKPRKNDED